MRLTYKQKRLIREKAYTRFGDDIEIVSIRSLKPKGYDKPDDTSIKVRYKKPGEKEKSFYTRKSYL